MGNSESSNPIRNMDKRTARREYRADFTRAITEYRRRNLAAGKGKIKRVSDDWFDGNIKVFVRKRPIFKHELDAFEFDVATCTSEDNIVIHDARMHNDMKRQIMNHHDFQFDRTFNENAKNDEVYNDTAKSLVNISCEGGYSTCLVYGQTGSGKTFTMSSIYEHAAYDIFNQLDTISERFSVPPTVSMSFVEIAGDLCHDLLNKFTPAQLLTGSDGSVHAFPVIEPTVSCAEELIAMIQHGMGVRTTAATGVHDQSSRSHAILRIYIQRHDLRTSEGANNAVHGGVSGKVGVEGTLTLVDLAGSEHRIDSMYHGKERRKETGNINASLMALKDCIRARAMGQVQSFQYRRSKLTQALKATFSLPSARTIIIATVSPASKDTEHSLNTLRHACIMHGQQDLKSADRETRFVTGGTVTSELIGEVNLTEIGRKNAGIKRAGGSLDGPKTHNGNSIMDSKLAKAANNEVEITDKERLRLRKAAELKSITKMLPQYRELLKHYRQQLGQNRQQAARLQRLPLDPNAVIEEEPFVETAYNEADNEHYDRSYESPVEDDEVGDEVHTFHSSLTKKDKPDREVQEQKWRAVDLHDLAMLGKQGGAKGVHGQSGRYSGGGEEDEQLIEDEAESYVERSRQRQSSHSKESAHSSHNTQSASRPKAQSQALQQYYNQQDEAENEEVEDEWEAPQGRYNAPQVPVSRQSASNVSKSSSRAPVTQDRPKSGSRRVVEEEDSYRSPPKPPASNTNNSHMQPAATGISPSKQRLDFQRLRSTIYEGAEGVPEHILQRQLTSLLTLHGYSTGEIELMFEMNALLMENESMKRAAQAPQQQYSQSQQQAAPLRRSIKQPPPSYQEELKIAPVRDTAPPPQAQQKRPVSLRHSPVRREEHSPVDDTPPTSLARAGARVVNSPVAAAGAAPARARSSPRPSAQVSAEQRSARLAEEKERREREGMAEAAAQLENQAAQRKARQDAAKALREQQEDDRRQKAARLAAQGAAQKKAMTDQTTASIRSAAVRNEEDPISTHSTAAASRASIRKHEDEIAYLTDQLRADSITEATQFAIKRSIAVRKAALLRERRAAAEKSYLVDDYEEAVPVKSSSTRHGAAFDVGIEQPIHPAGGSERASSRGAASRPKAQGFNAAEFEPLPVAKVQSGRDRYGGSGAQSGPAGRARKGVPQVDPEEAFGGPRWDSNSEGGSEPAQTAFGEDQYTLAGRSKSTGQLQYSPRGQPAQRNDLEEQMAQVRVSPRGAPTGSSGNSNSPRAEEYAPRGSRRHHGAASAPFGNEYSYENSP